METALCSAPYARFFYAPDSVEKVIQQLKQEVQFPGDEELKHIWPTRHAHINIYGRYHFNRELLGKKQQLRDLRQRGFQP
ncbi:hypothetical protein [Nostoc sp. MG11]|uniref:hypothetical protein n=1 Tax=Nostoc sp. MG11 TaxID=2721166 RepID=UPI001867F22D|nr:hypothetical protein [Nostoc sp. MG11]